MLGRRTRSTAKAAASGSPTEKPPARTASARASKRKKLEEVEEAAQVKPSTEAEGAASTSKLEMAEEVKVVVPGNVAANVAKAASAGVDDGADWLREMSSFGDDEIADDDDGWNDGGDAYEGADAVKAAVDPSGEDKEDEAHRVAQQRESIDELASLLGIPPDQASLLLQCYKWDSERVLTLYMDDAEKVCREAGLPSPFAEGAASLESLSARVQGAECSLCREDGDLAMSSLACGHRYCDTCWGTFLRLKIEVGTGQIKCPEPSCSLRVTEKLIRGLCAPEVVSRHQYFLQKSFVDDSAHKVWCPMPNCGLAVDTRDAKSKFVCCAARHHFCSECQQEAHAPVSCPTVKQWLKKCSDDSETYNWLSANTQDCPQCKSTIEKNGGCNHMTCRKCKGEFCWVCMGVWKDHTDFFSCNRYSAETGAAKETAKTASRAALDRYLFYYHRFINHQNSAKLEAVTRVKAEAKMAEMNELAAEEGGWGAVEFVQLGTEEAIACRTLLKWTYVFAHAIPDAAAAKERFLFLQQDLESKTERLSELLESDAEKLRDPAVRKEVLSLRGILTQTRRHLLEGVDEELTQLEAAQGASEGDAAAKKGEGSGAGAAAVAGAGAAGAAGAGAEGAEATGETVEAKGRG